MKRKTKAYLLKTYVLFLDFILLIYLLIKYFISNFIKRKSFKLSNSVSNWKSAEFRKKRNSEKSFEFQIFRIFLNLYPNFKNTRKKSLSDFTYEMF